MKIAFIGQKGIPAHFGGIERHVEQLSTRLVSLGHDVTVYARPWYTDTQRKQYKGVHITSLFSFKTKHLDAATHTIFSSIHAVVKGFDVIHYHGVGPALFSFIPKLLFSRAKVVVTFHCIDRKHQKWGKFARFMLRLGEWTSNRFADQTIVVSEVLKAYCKEVYDNETTYIPNGISDPTLYEAQEITQRFGLEKNGYIAMFSRLIRHKGIHHLIKAYKQLDTNLKLVIAGDSFFTDDYVAELKELAGDDERIVFTGFQSGRMLGELFSNAYMIAHPSESEGLSVAVLEAMSYGKAVVVSDIPENKEAVKGYGFTHKDKDVNDLAKKLQFLIDNPGEMEHISAQAREYVLRDYNWDTIAEATSELYKNTLYANIVPKKTVSTGKGV